MVHAYSMLQKVCVSASNIPMNPEISHPNESSTLNQGELLLNRISKNTDFPTFSKNIIEINRKFSSRSNDSSASDLSNTILKDYALTNKLLKLVNSAFYNLTGGKVTTVTRAVVLLGFEKVRLAATNLMVFDLLDSKSAGAELKEAFVEAFWCGLIAKDVAESKIWQGEEEAIICAMLHNLGKHIALLYLSAKCNEIARLISKKGLTETEASRRALGISFEELGIAVAERWHFPAEIIDSMKRLSREELQMRNGNIDALRAVANFSNELCGIINNTEGKKRESALSTLTKQYMKHIAVSPEELDDIITASFEKVKIHADLLSINFAQSPFLERLTVSKRKQQIDEDGQHSGEELELEVSKMLVDGSATSDVAAGRLNGDHKANPVDVVLSGIQDMSAAMVRDYNVNDIALMALESMYRGFGFHRVIFFGMKKDGKQMEARFGFGNGIHSIAGKVIFTTSETRDIFCIALAKGKDLIIENTDESQIHEVIPEWFQKMIDAPAFVFLPVTFEKACLGAFYADRQSAGPPLGEGQYKYLIMLRNQLVLAIKYRK